MADQGTGGARWMRRGAEVLTIVFSILLALAADAAWSYRGDRAEEGRLLQGLHQEFLEAEREVENDLEARREILDRLQLLRGVRSGDLAPPDSVAVLVSALLDWRFYTPAHAVLDDAVSSGRLDLIRSPEIRRALMAYDQQRGRLEVFDARERDFVSEHLEPYLIVRVALDRLLDEPPTPDDAARVLSLMGSDEAFAGLVALKQQRTEEASTFSRVVQRHIEDVLASLDLQR